MPSQDDRLVARLPSGQGSRHNAHARGDRDAISEISTEGPPDYATIDPNELNRSITPFPRPPSPTPEAEGETWAVGDSDDDDRPDSSSYTSSRPWNMLTRAHARRLQLANIDTGNQPDPVAQRGNRKRALSTSTAGSLTGQKGTPQVPATARLGSSRSGKALPQAVSSGSLFTLANNNQSAAGEKKRGLISSLSRGDWSTVGSFFSQSVHSSSSRPRLQISRPYDFRHEAGSGIGSSSSAFLGHVDPAPTGDEEEQEQNEATRTSRVLLDIRTESRLGNQTSLPVTMPNVISPIDLTMFDADCGRNSTTRASVRTAVNRFQSPPSPELTVYRGQTPSAKSPFGNGPNYGSKSTRNLSATKSCVFFWLMAALTQLCLVMVVSCVTISAHASLNDEKMDGGVVVALVCSALGFLVFGVLLSWFYAHRLSGRAVSQTSGTRIETFFFKMSPERLVFSVLMMLTQASLFSSTAAITVITLNSRADLEVGAVVIAWLIASIVAFMILGVILASFYARRVSSRIVRSHRAEQRDEEWIEMRSRTFPNFSHPSDQNDLAREIIKSASEGAQRLQSDEDCLNGSAAAFAVQNRQHTDGNLSQNQNPRASLIGIARSDSLIRHQNKTATPSTNTTASAGSYESEGTEKPIISKRSSSPAGHTHSDPATVYSAEDMSMISMLKQKQPYIPHSLAVADLSPEGPARPLPSVANSGTKSTITSLISSYASEAAGPSNAAMTRTYSQEALGRREEALGSHPVLLSRPRPIATEAGPSSSQKSSDRIPVSGSDGSINREWSIRDGFITRIPTMTPIEEQSEAGTRSSVLTGHRGSQCWGSESEAR